MVLRCAGFAQLGAAGLLLPALWMVDIGLLSFRLRLCISQDSENTSSVVQPAQAREGCTQLVRFEVDGGMRAARVARLPGGRP